MDQVLKNIISKYPAAASPRKMHFNLGVHYLKKAQAEMARQEINKALAQQAGNDDPQNWELQFLKGQTFLLSKAAGDQATGIRLLAEAATGAGDEGTRQEIYQIAVGQVSKAVARELTDWAVRIQPNGADAGYQHLLAGQILQLTDKKDGLQRAKEHFKMAQGSLPESSLVTSSLEQVRVLEQLDRLEEQVNKLDFGAAIETIKEIELHDHPQSKYLRTTVAYFVGAIQKPTELNEAAALIQELIGELEQKDQIGALQLIARLQISAGQFKEAITTIDEANKLDYTNKRSVYIKTQALLEGGINPVEGKSLLHFLGDSLPDFLRETEAELQHARTNNATLLAFKAFVLLELPETDFDELNSFLDEHAGTIHSASAHLIRANISEATGGEVEQIAQLLFDAGREYNIHASYTAALHCFQRTQDLIETTPELSKNLPVLKELGFEQANAIYGQSHLTTYPYWEVEELLEADALWHRAYSSESAVLKPDQYWFYEVAGFIKESLIIGQHQDVDYWQCLEYGARGLLLQRGFHSLACMTRFFRVVDMLQPAKVMVDSALPLDEKYSFAVDEAALVALNAGDFETANQFIERGRALLDDPGSIKHYDAFVHYHEGRNEAALEIFDENQRNSPADIWTAYMRMLTLENMGRMEQSRNVASWIIANKSRYTTEHYFLGWAYQKLGDRENALAAFTQEKEKNNYLPAYVNLFSHHLSVGEVDKAEEYLEYVLRWNKSGLRIKEILGDLETMKGLLEIETEARFFNLSSSQLAGCMDENGRDWAGRLERSRKAITEADPADQLRDELARLQPEKGSSAWIGLKLGLMLLLKELNRPAEALEIAEEVKAFAPAGLDDFVSETVADLATIQTSEEEAGIVSNWVASVENGQGLLQAGVMSRIENQETFWRLYDRLDQLKSSHPWADLIHSNLLDHWSSLLESGEDHHKMELDPIVIWLPMSMIPADHSLNWVLLGKYIPDLRAELESNYGIQLPSVTIKDANNYAHGVFAISINEIARAYDTIPAEVLEQDKTVEDFRYSTRLIIDRLRLVMLQRLQQFVTVADARRQIEMLQADPLDGPNLTAYTKLLQSLLKDGVPITNGAKILETFKAHYKQDGYFEELLAETRQQLREQLPVNQPDIKQLTIDTALETTLAGYISERGGKRFTEMTPAQCKSIVDEIGALVPTDVSEQLKTVLVVRDRINRYYLRQLLLSTHSQIRVAAESELLTTTTTEL